MIQLSDEQLNQLGKEALVVIVSSLQDQLLALQSQLDQANAQLSDNNRQIELLTEQIRIMNQRFFGRNRKQPFLKLTVSFPCSIHSTKRNT